MRAALERPVPEVVVAREQLGALERTVQHHMARARSAALGSAGALSAPLEAARSVARALSRLNAERGLDIAVTGDASARVRADAQDLVEMVGNLMENACRWATRRVAVEIATLPDSGLVRIAVEDDGPGLPEDPANGAAALARGVRLDEAMPGAGLGLAIVSDLAALHGGGLALGRGVALGGARAVLDLPAGG
jgi:signal transduction histidine kinase